MTYVSEQYPSGSGQGRSEYDVSTTYPTYLSRQGRDTSYRRRIAYLDTYPSLQGKDTLYRECIVRGYMYRMYRNCIVRTCLVDGRIHLFGTCIVYVSLAKSAIHSRYITIQEIQLYRIPIHVSRRRDRKIHSDTPTIRNTSTIHQGYIKIRLREKTTNPEGKSHNSRMLYFTL